MPTLAIGIVVGVIIVALLAVFVFINRQRFVLLSHSHFAFRSIKYVSFYSVLLILLFSKLYLFRIFNNLHNTHTILKSEEEGQDSPPNGGHYDKNLKVVIQDPMEDQGTHLSYISYTPS